jgi:hypothetical protein
VIQPPLVFVDLETVTLDPYGDVIWEIAAILRDPDKANISKWVWQVRPDVHKLSGFSRPDFEKRFRVPDNAEAMLWTDLDEDWEEPGRPMSRTSVADMFASLTHRRHVVGAVPDFDTWRMRFFVERWAPHTALTWHYHLRDVENLAVGWLCGVEIGRERERGAQLTTGPRPARDSDWRPDWLESDGSWKSDNLYKAMGINPNRYARHTALGDTELNMAVYDKVFGS